MTGGRDVRGRLRALYGVLPGRRWQGGRPALPWPTGWRWGMTSERGRLTALYGGLLVLAGVLLIGLIYLLVRDALYSSISSAITTVVPPEGFARTQPWQESAPAQAVPGHLVGGVTERGASYAAARRLSTAAEDAALDSLLAVSGVALALFSTASMALAWWMAGRVLRPVGVITARARRLSGENLHERLALNAPPGELKELADTFDGMLDRIEQLVSAQQRFAANAAHELRTSLAVQRAAAEIGLADEPSPRKVARIRDKLIETAGESEQLIEGLLLLAVCDQGIQRREPAALDTIATTVAAALEEEAERRDVTVETSVKPLTVQGDTVLLDHLVHNLVANAIRHNHPGGAVRVRVGGNVLQVTNTGPVVAPKAVPRLFEPFRRAKERRHAPGEGVGLGLSIVASIARAHGATATATANTGGGLTVRVTFRRSP